MVITGLGLLSLTTVQYDTPYSRIWFLLIPIGLGNGLVMSPMTTAAMSTVPGRRAGMASATLNTVRQVGSVFGIAVLGNIVTRSFVDHIPGALAGLHLPAPAVAAIKVAAKQGQESAPAKAPPGIDLTAVSNAVSNAFTQAFHTGLWVSGLLLLAGAPLAFAMIRMKSPHEASKKARAKAREAAAGEAAAAAAPVDVAPIEAAASVEGGRPAVQE